MLGTYRFSGRGDGHGKRGSRGTCNKRRFDKQKLFQVNGLSKRSRFFYKHVGKFLRLKPDADHRVTFNQSDHGIQSRLFERRGEQHRGVKAVGDSAA